MSHDAIGACEPLSAQAILLSRAVGSGHTTLLPPNTRIQDMTENHDVFGPVTRDNVGMEVQSEVLLNWLPLVF